MAAFQASSYSSFHLCSTARKIEASLHKPNVSVSKLLVHELNRRKLSQNLKTTHTHIETKPRLDHIYDQKKDQDQILQEMYAIMNIIADRVEMHRNIGQQRDNWNHLLLTSVNGMIATALTMAGITAIGGGGGAPFWAMKVSSTLLYTAVTGVLAVMNRLQPSQLAEEQRNAARLFKQLHEEIKAVISIRTPNSNDVKNAMMKVLALDKAYPLPLFGTMLDKFPAEIKPAVWWPEETQTPQPKRNLRTNNKNGWDENLENKMREIVNVLKRKDTEEYLKLSKTVLKINRILAISGPIFTGIAAIGSASYGSIAAFLAVVSGALGIVVNSIEHGGQIGMVFEMYRSSAGYFRLMEESIESTVEKKGAEEREHGEMFEVKVALQLGRSLSELRDLADSAKIEAGKEEEFASKLF